MTSDRCPWAVKYGVTLHTRCFRQWGHPGSHLGRGLRDCLRQSVRWQHGDRREYLTSREDNWSWEES